MKPQLRALIVEDDEDDARLLVRELDRGGYRVVSRRVDTADALHEALSRETWDVVLCDYMMPRFSGEAALRMLRESAIDLPFIFVSGTIGEDTAVAAMKAGAHDYIMKDNLKRLVPAVRRELLDAVDRKQHRAAENQLRMSEQKYRHLFQSMREAALLVAEETGKIIDANEQAEQLFGRNRGELLGVASASLCLPERGEYAAEAPWQLPPCGESMVRRKNGVLVPVDVSISRVELHNRPFVLTLFRDISLRRRTESALRNVLRHARTMLINAVVSTDPDEAGGALQWEWHFLDEEAAREVLPLMTRPGLSYADAWRASIHREDRDRLAEVADDALRQNKPGWRQEFRCVDQGGKVHWFTQVASVEAESSRRWEVIAITTDITERKLAETDLTWRTAFFEAQVESALDGMLVVDRDGRKILQNRRFTELWKVPPEIAQVSDDATQFEYALKLVKDPEVFAKKVADLYAHPDAVSQDEIELEDGTILDRHSWPVRDKAGNYYGRIWIFRDLTERRRLEEQFRQAQKMEAIGQLAGGIAHDFNNMLTVVQMHTSMLLEDPARAGAISAELRQVLEACDRAANLTRQLLTFSRRQQKSARWLDLGEVIGSMLKLLRRIVGEEIGVDARFAPSLPLVHADPGMMEQVLMNLVVNARDAMPAGGRLVVSLDSVALSKAQIPAHADVPGGSFVRLQVSDTGVGIAPEILPRIFEPFFTTKDVGRGTGLGLATVFGIVEQHHGWIEVSSVVGQGATFQVFLPAQEAGAPAAAAPSAANEAGGGRETILLVEDDIAVRDIAALALRQRGYAVLEAGSAEEALAQWDRVQGAIDLLLTDLVLPGGVSGLMLADELRHRRPGLATIYTSGYSPDVLSGRLKLKEGTAYLTKPYSFVDLASHVRRQLDTLSPEPSGRGGV